MKKLISLLLVLCMVLGMSVSAFAEDEDFATRINAANNDDVIQLTSNVTSTSSFTIDGKTLTIDLNGYTWTIKKGDNNLKNDAELIIRDSTNKKSKVVFQVASSGESYIRLDAHVQNSASNLTIDGITMEAFEFNAGTGIIGTWASKEGSSVKILNSVLNFKGNNFGLYSSSNMNPKYLIQNSKVSISVGESAIGHSNTVVIDNSTVDLSGSTDGFNCCKVVEIKNNSIVKIDGTGIEKALGFKFKYNYGPKVSIDKTSSVDVKNCEGGDLYFNNENDAYQFEVECNNGNISIGKIVAETGVDFSKYLILPDCLSVVDGALVHDVDKCDAATPPQPPVGSPVVEEDYEKDEGETLSVRIKFDGVDEADFEEIKVNLLKNGKKYDSEELSASKVSKKDWRFEWDNLDEYDDWSVALAAELEGYDAEVVNLRGNYWTITLTPAEVEAPSVSVDKANPETGASDFVGVAAALAVVSVLGGAALSLKK